MTRTPAWSSALLAAAGVGLALGVATSFAAAQPLRERSPEPLPSGDHPPEAQPLDGRQTAPSQTAPQEPALQRAASEQAASQQAASQQTAPRDVGPGASREDAGGPHEGAALARPEVDGPELPIELAGCAEGLDVVELRNRVALEAAEPSRPGVWVDVHLDCGSADARVTVRELGRGTIESGADLGHAEGTARTWALAIVIADLLRRTPDVSTPEASAAPSPATELTASVVDPESSAIGGPLPPAAESAPVQRAARAWLSVAALGRLSFDSITGLAGLAVAFRYDWFRAGVRLSATHRGHELGDVTAGLFLLDVALVPLQHVDPVWAAAAEVFVHGGALYGAGIAASATVPSSDAIDLVLGVGVGLRLEVAVDSNVALDLGLRAGFEPWGTELLAGSDVLVRVYGFFASLDVGVSLALE